MDQVLEGNCKEIDNKRDWVLQIVWVATEAQEIDLKHNQREWVQVPDRVLLRASGLDGQDWGDQAA